MRTVWAFIRGGAALLFALTLAAAGVGMWLDRDRMQAAWDGLMGRERRRLEPAAGEEAFRRRVLEFEESRQLREKELRERELVARASLTRAEAERAAAEAAKRDAETLAAQSRQPSSRAREFDAQVELLSRIEATTASAIMKGWTDGQVATYLKAMRPSRGAEIVDAMRTDPVWQERLPRILAPAEGKP